MPVQRILIQLDCDPQASSFDAIVAIDAGAEMLLQHGGVTPDSAVPLVHGAMFTRGGSDLAATAIFIGGSDMQVAEAVYDRVRATFFGPVRVSVMLDPAGANTTASAAVVAAARHLPLGDPELASGCQALVLGGTGPVGQRVARLLAGKGVAVGVASRSLERAKAVCERIAAAVPEARLEAIATVDVSLAGSAFGTAIEKADLIVSAGAAGTVMLDAAGRLLASRARVLIDLNAVPPAGVDGIVSADKSRQSGVAIVYGALGIGSIKMKIHRTAVSRLFESNSLCLDAEALLAVGETLA